MNLPDQSHSQRLKAFRWLTQSFALKPGTKSISESASIWNIIHSGIVRWFRSSTHSTVATRLDDKCWRSYFRYWNWQTNQILHCAVCRQDNSWIQLKLNERNNILTWQTYAPYIVSAAAFRCCSAFWQFCAHFGHISTSCQMPHTIHIVSRWRSHHPHNMFPHFLAAKYIFLRSK